MIELKPCPFCGRTDTLGVYTWADIDEDLRESAWDCTHYAVCCDNQKGGCGATIGRDAETPEQAAEGWNRRV